MSSSSSTHRFHESGAAPHMAASGAGATRGAATPAILGVQYSAEEERTVYKKVSTVNGYTFEVPPVNRFHSKSAETKFLQLAGGLNPRFEATRFDNMRERLQVMEKREKDSYLQAMAMIYAERLGNHFVAAKDVDCAELERCFYPTYMPSYDTVLRAVGLRRPLWWRQGSFSALENISRLPLDRCSVKRETQMSFEEWYSLFLNYYQPFNTLAFLCLVTAQSMLYTKELVHSVADYLVARHSLIADGRAKKAPILFLGARTGKFGALLNQTGKLPVSVLHAHENPNMNPYLLVIPPHKQAAFKPNPIVKMKNQAALEKYEPSIVLFSDMIANTDPTVQIRQQGSVREYIYFGVPDSYIEGHGWDTWGYPKYRERKTDPVPPFVRDGFARLALPHLSRWMLYKLDDTMQMGTSAVTAWVRKPLMPSHAVRWSWQVSRLRPFF